ncbi:MAG: M20/M25/M40 family metallo-hydrolase [Clostridiales bacterium]|nr:M20/M25/M40 family metallo-hydrolase [Clostridiales bacterium]
MINTEKLLEKLTYVPAVSGCEENLYSVLNELLSEYGKIEMDSMNNIFCTFGSGRHFLIDAHIDEIGFAVTSVSEKGFLKLAPSGGIDKRLLPGSEVDVWGKEHFSGIITAVPPHLQKNEKQVPDISDVAVDIGMDFDEALKNIPLGSRVTFKRHFDFLLNNCFSSNCLDDKAGAAALILAADKLKKFPVKITLMFSAQEEVGTRGAKSGLFGKNVDEAICVDVSFAMTPDCKIEECGEIGKGAMIGISPILNRDFSKGLVNTAEKNKINYQIEVMSGKTGTNADVIALSESGIKTALISIPLKYMHTPVEIVKTEDIESVADLMVSYIKERAGVKNA